MDTKRLRTSALVLLVRPRRGRGDGDGAEAGARLRQQECKTCLCAERIVTDVVSQKQQLSHPTTAAVVLRVFSSTIASSTVATRPWLRAGPTDGVRPV
jgi:hypothetical protein